jgi:hypothetical protein
MRTNFFFFFLTYASPTGYRSEKVLRITGDTRTKGAKIEMTAGTWRIDIRSQFSSETGDSMSGISIQ